MTLSLMGDDVSSLHEDRNEVVGTNYISYID
jgi:hypothetical protein